MLNKEDERQYKKKRISNGYIIIRYYNGNSNMFNVDMRRKYVLYRTIFCKVSGDFKERQEQKICIIYKSYIHIIYFYCYHVILPFLRGCYDIYMK